MSNYDDIRGNSPDTDLDPDNKNVQDNTARKLTVRDILIHIHMAAQQSRRTVSAFEDTLLYIEEKEKIAKQLPGSKQLRNSLYHVHAILCTSRTPQQKISDIEAIIARDLNLPFQAVQS